MKCNTGSCLVEEPLTQFSSCGSCRSGTCIKTDLEKAFDRVPRKVLWWAMRKLGVEEGIYRLVQALYKCANCRVRVNHKLGQPFDVKVGLHQGSVFSPLLFIIVLEALSEEFRTGCPWELLYDDDLLLFGGNSTIEPTVVTHP